MESLLRWGIENSIPESGDASELHSVAADVAEGKRSDLLKPGMLEAIMGKSDATLMMEAMQVAADESQTEDNRTIALDNMEMLVEQIDNANNLDGMKLWPPLVKLLSSSSDSIRHSASWVCGTAVQNNPKAQNAFLALHPIPTLLALISTTTTFPADQGAPTPPPSTETRSRSLYALSGALKHLPEAGDLLDAQEGWGWEVLKGGLSDPAISIRRKTAFLLSTLLLSTQSFSTATSFAPWPAPSEPAPTTSSTSPLVSSFRARSIPSTLLESLTPDFHPPGVNGDEAPACEDADYREKAVRVLVTLLERDGLESAEKKTFKALLSAWSAEEVGMAEVEKTETERALDA